MHRRKVLFVCHNHPSVRPGGAETYALEVYEALRTSGELEPILLARGGRALANERMHDGALIAPVNDDPNQYFFIPDDTNYDWLNGTSPRKELYTRHFRDFLEAFEPDIVHFQHTLFLGYDLIRQVRNSLPHAAIVYTLHEYIPICHNQGQMVRTQNRGLCSDSSPRRCNECFPSISPQAFFLRKRFIQAHFALVDLFLAPSQFLLERYVQWGIPRDRIRFEEYGRQEVSPSPGPTEERPRNRLAFFGQFTSFKGADVLLRAMRLLLEEDRRLRSLPMWDRLSGKAPPAANGRGGAAHLWLHGANLDLQPDTYQKEIHALLEATREVATFVGRYEHAELPRLMANIDWVIVPSIWWENSPLVIQEAFQHHRPVICSDIGGMREKVAHGTNGLHFRVGDPVHLAEVIRQATTTHGLWEALHAGVRHVYPMRDHLASLIRIYRSLLDGVPLPGEAHGN